MHYACRNPFPAIVLVCLSVSVATAQERVLIGRSVDGGIVFQTLIHRGTSRVHSEMEAIGQGSRTESHARLDDGVPWEGPSESISQTAQPPLSATSDQSSASSPPAAVESGGHLIGVRVDEGWRACGLTPDLAKAKHTVQVLKQQGIDARLFQFLPLPDAVQKLPLLLSEKAIGVAVQLTGEVYGVTKTGQLIEVPL